MATDYLTKLLKERLPLLWIGLSLASLIVLICLCSDLGAIRIVAAVTLAALFPVVATAYKTSDRIEERARQIRLFSNSWSRESVSSDESDEMIERHEQEYGPFAYSICVVPAVGLAIVGWLVVLSTFGESSPTTVENGSAYHTFNLPLMTAQAMAFGFLGAMVFSCQLLFRRFTTQDLKPSIFLRCAVSLFCGLTFCYVVFSAAHNFSEGFVAVEEAGRSEALGGNGNDDSAGKAKANVETLQRKFDAAEKDLNAKEQQLKDPNLLDKAEAQKAVEAAQTVANEIKVKLDAAETQLNSLKGKESEGQTKKVGAIDLDVSKRGLTGSESLIGAIIAFSLGYFPNLAIRWFSRVAYRTLGENARRADSQPLEAVDGISILHQERLNEEGLDNLQDLAFANIGKLISNTPFTAQQLMDWSNQALLYLFLEYGEFEIYRRVGIRTAVDFVKVWDSLGSDDQKKKDLAMMLQSTPERIDSLYLSLRQYLMPVGTTNPEAI